MISEMMTEADFLEHVGVKGMKWGVRKKTDNLRTSPSMKKPQTDEEKAALRKKLIIGGVATAAALAIVAGVYLNYDAKVLSGIKTAVTAAETNGLDFSKLTNSDMPDKFLARGSEFTRRSYQKNSAWATPLRTYAVEGGDTNLIKAYGNNVFKFATTRDIKIAGLNTQLNILTSPDTGKQMRNAAAQEYSKYSVSGQRYVKKVLSDDKFAKLTIAKLRKNIWDGLDDEGSPTSVAATYANILKSRNYAGVNDLNLPGSAARVLLDQTAFARTK